ncbi:MAG: hypothetical protein Q9174_002135 [Haloplaca sp. 1 TL-2023]
MSSRPITIVGAGLAGLSVGRCLKQFGISAVVLERKSSSTRYDYGITLHSWAFQPLLNVLQIDEALFREKLAIKGDVLEAALAPAVKSDAGTFRCHRGRLEKWLQEGQDIRWENNVQSVQTSSQGISVQLKDTKSFETGVLIGADGVHSQVRKCLAPESQLRVLPFVVFNGKRQFTQAKFQELFESRLWSRAIVQERHGDIVLEISINEYTPKHVDIGYTYSRPARTHDPLHKPERAIPGATNVPEEFFSELEDLKVEEPFRSVFQPAEVRRDRVLHWLMRSNLASRAEVDHLAKQSVLLVGDAVHAMPILGGEGANNAMKDGVDLAQHILNQGTENFLLFVDARFEAWKTGVEDGEKRLAEMHGQSKASL